MKQLTLEDLVAAYTATQDTTPEALTHRLNSIQVLQQPAGFMLLRYCDLSSSRIGQHVILPYGPNNTYKVLPEANHIFHPLGLASDSAQCVGFTS